MSDTMKLKVYKELALIRGRILNRIIQDARKKFEYHKDNNEELLKFVEYIANPKQWDYSGLLYKEDIARLELLEYLLDDDRNEIIQYKEWKPTKFE